MDTTERRKVKYNVTYTYQGAKYNGGQYDTKPEAYARAHDLILDKWNGVRIEPTERKA